MERISCVFSVLQTLNEIKGVIEKALCKSEYASIFLIITSWYYYYITHHNKKKVNQWLLSQMNAILKLSSSIYYLCAMGQIILFLWNMMAFPVEWKWQHTHIKAIVSWVRMVYGTWMVGSVILNVMIIS